jgi:hypothetical protein
VTSPKWAVMKHYKTFALHSFLKSPFPRGEKWKPSVIQITVNVFMAYLLQTYVRHPNNSHLTMAIATCIHSDGLPYRFVVLLIFRRLYIMLVQLEMTTHYLIKTM